VTAGSISAPRAGEAAQAPPLWLIGFLAAVTLARLVAAAAIPLTEDEAYYRLWAASLQLGYYDHPPMIAWWIRAGTSLLGDHPLGLRLVPTLASGLTGLVVYDLALRLGAARQTAARASVWYNATLLAGMGGAIATPDAAATPFWVLTLWCLARTGEGRRDATWWILAGVTAGLACLSKYSALFIAPGVLIWLLLTPQGQADLRRPWPWAAALVAAGLFAVNVGWNAQHHWVTFGKQFGRIEPHGLRPSYLAELLVGQFILLNPIIALFAARGLRSAWRGPAESEGFDARLLAASALPFAAYLVVHSLHARVEAHWPAPIYPALAIIAAAQATSAQGWIAALRAWAAPFGLGVSAIVLVHLALPVTDIRGLNDPTGALRGWPTFAKEVEALRTREGATWIGTLSYGTTAQLAAAGVAAPVVEIGERDRYPAGDASWRADLSRPGLVVDLDRRDKASVLSRCFAEVRELPGLVRSEGASRRDRYAAFLVSGPQPDFLTQGCSLALHGGRR
jgi:4-amino-4-deoxy-L-arabinose transferase-like glycosyltransferase